MTKYNATGEKIQGYIVYTLRRHCDRGYLLGHVSPYNADISFKRLLLSIVQSFFNIKMWTRTSPTRSRSSPTSRRCTRRSRSRPACTRCSTPNRSAAPPPTPSRPRSTAPGCTRSAHSCKSVQLICYLFSYL